MLFAHATPPPHTLKAATHFFFSCCRRRPPSPSSKKEKTKLHRAHPSSLSHRHTYTHKERASRNEHREDVWNVLCNECSSAAA
ncbi:hypothetical protein, conserved [Leishmania donovani]|uniref:Uncharacterized protein n=1 Tax=Leishmania donovani TaxID=5661 RepID=E9BU84_LEIDO|nr:hypothetical protein, conserved [Leishmania donovani]CBZ38813.1 hypothetical protein, conserved [Leishmania donovani]